MYFMMKANFNYKEEEREYIEQFETEYLQVGIEILTSVARIITLLVIILSLAFLTPKHPFYWRATTIWPINFIFLWIIDKYLSQSKKWAKLFIILTTIFWGFFIMHANLKGSTYTFYEVWLAFILFCQYLGILMFADWIKVVIWFYTIVISFLVLVSK